MSAFLPAGRSVCALSLLTLVSLATPSAASARSPSLFPDATRLPPATTTIVLPPEPEAVCVPDLVGPPPLWCDAGLTAEEKDARWSNALVDKATNGDHDARLRALYDQGTLFVDVLVAGDPTLDPGSDVVLFALSDATGAAPELLIRFDPLAACPDELSCVGAGQPVPASAVTYAAAEMGPTSVTWGDLGEENPSADFFVDHVWVTADSAGDTFVWTLSFTLEVPTDAAGELRADQRVYANAVAWWPGWTSGTYTELPLLCDSSSPTSDDCRINFDALTELPDDLPTGNLEDSWALLETGCCEE